MAWVTPLGLPVVQPYRRAGANNIIKTALQQITLTSERDHIRVSSQKQKSAFPPNFVHSMDATHMLMTCLKMKNEGKVFASVHDSYWTHACDINLMNEVVLHLLFHSVDFL
jgi:DNA-directed RNA polymerase